MVSLFTCGNFTLVFYCFFDFLYFFNDFSNPFIVFSRPSFLYEPNFRFSGRVFVHMRPFDIDFLFFLNDLSYFFRSDFPIHS